MEFPEEYKSKWFIFLLIVFLLFMIVFKSNIDIPKTFKVIIVGILPIFQLLFNINSVMKKSKEIFTKIVHWFYFSTMIMFFLMYLAVSVNEPDIAAIILISTLGLIFLSALISNLFYFWNSKSVPRLLITYTALAVTTIVFFGYTYATISANEGSYLLDNTIKEPIKDINDYMYFSATVFFGTIFGDIIPVNYMRYGSIVEIFLSTLIHVILIGIIVSKFFNKGNNQNIAMN